MFCADNAKTTEVVLARAYNFEGLQLSHSVQFSIANLQMGFTRRFMNHYLMADGTRFTDKQGYETMFYTDEVKTAIHACNKPYFVRTISKKEKQP